MYYGCTLNGEVPTRSCSTVHCLVACPATLVLLFGQAGPPAVFLPSFWLKLLLSDVYPG